MNVNYSFKISILTKLRDSMFIFSKFIRERRKQKELHTQYLSCSTYFSFFILHCSRLEEKFTLIKGNGSKDHEKQLPYYIIQPEKLQT